MQGAPVAEGTIVKLGSPKLMEMMLAAYQKKYGEDFKDSKDYEHFARTIALVLSKNTQNRRQATLYINGEATGVVVTLIALDSVGEQAKQFRTLDGKYRVVFEVTDGKYSGWKTSDGTPLELIFTEPGHESADDEAYQAEQASKARRLWISLKGTWSGTTFAATSGSLGGLDKSDLDLREYMRTAAFQSMKLKDFAAVMVSGTQYWTAEFFDQLSNDAYVRFTATVKNGSATVTVTKQTKYDEDKSDNAEKVGGGTPEWKKETGEWLAYWVSGKTMAQMPIQVS